jgi:hypothetical protein
MAFHLEQFTATIANSTNGATLVQLTSVFNGVVPTLNSGFQVPQSTDGSAPLSSLGLVAAVSAHLVRVRMQTPRWAPYPYPDLSPQNRGTAFESPPRIWDFMANPMPMTPTDELDMFAAQNHSTTEAVYGAVIFTDGMSRPIPPGRLFQARWTSSTTLTAGAFTPVPITLDIALPAGMYALVGASVFSATGLFFQMLPATGPVWRPGGICVQAFDSFQPAGQRALGWMPSPYMGWGTWMTFRQNTPPQVNVFATSADTAQIGWLDLVYMGP